MKSPLIRNFVSYTLFHQVLTDSYTILMRLLIILFFGCITFAKPVFAGDDRTESVIASARTAQLKFRKGLDAYRLDLYSKSFIDLYDRDKSGFVMKSATLLHSQWYWRKSGEVRELETARRHLHGFWFGDYDLNRLPIIDDLSASDIPVGNSSVVGPLAAFAAEYYTYELLDDISWNGRTAWQLRVKPKSRLEPLMNGVVYIDKESYAVIGFEVEFNHAVKILPQPDVLKLKETFVLHDGYWLPQDMEWGMQFNITFPWPTSAQWRYTARTINAVVNPEIPGDIFKGRPVERTSDAHYKDSTFWMDQPLPLSPAEKDGFDNLSNLPWNIRFINPDIAAYSRKRDRTNVDWGLRLIPDIRYNRVEGIFLGGKVEFDDLAYKRWIRNFTLKTKYGYGFADHDFKYAFEAKQKFFDKRFYAGGRYFDDVANKESASDEALISNSLTSLVYRYDIYNYYYVKGYTLFTGVRPLYNLKVEFSFTDRRDSSAELNARYALIKNFYKNFDSVSTINPGQLRRLAVNMNYTIGNGTGIFSRETYWVLDATVEHANREWLKSDFDFTRIFGSARFHIPTTRRGSLDGRFSAGLGTKGLPRQYSFHLYGGTTPYVLKTVDFLESTPNHFQGNMMAALTMEHNFGGTLLERTGLPILKRGFIDVFPTFSVGYVHASGKSLANLRDLNRPLVETGFAIGDIYRFVRLDFTWRLTQRQKGNRNFGSSIAILLQSF